MSTFLPIDFQKSIAKERMVYKTTSSLLFTYAISTFNALIVIAIVTMPAFVKLPATLTTLRPYYIIFIFIFYCWAITNAVLLNAFVKIKGFNPENNQKDIIEALSKYFKLENLDNTKPNVIRDIRLPWAYKTGRAITCLLDEDIIYLNIVRLMRPANMSFNSAVFMYLKCKRVARQFQKLQTPIQS